MYIIYADNCEYYSSHKIWLVGYTSSIQEARGTIKELNDKISELIEEYDGFYYIPPETLADFDENVEFSPKVEYKYQEVSELDLENLKKIKLFEWD